MPPPVEQPFTPVEDFPRLLGMDHVEFYVGNARQAAYYYRTAFGMRLVATQGPEMGIRDRSSYMLEQGAIRLVLTSALRPNHPVADHVYCHGDGVHSVALTVEDAKAAWSAVRQRGAVLVQEPTELRDGFGVVRQFAIATYGGTIHTFVDRSQYQGPFLPGYAAAPPDTLCRPVGLLHIDHLAGNVPHGEMDRWATFYQQVLGFRLDSDRGTGGHRDAALLSRETADGNGRLRFPIHEPAGARRKAQIEEYLDFYLGAGVQHIALATGDIGGTVTRLRAQGVPFLEVPGAYYDDLSRRSGLTGEPLDTLRQLGLLVDRDEEGLLLQAFSRPVEDRPTVLYEIIERQGGQNFNNGNLQALLEALDSQEPGPG